MSYFEFPLSKLYTRFNSKFLPLHSNRTAKQHCYSPFWLFLCDFLCYILTKRPIVSHVLNSLINLICIISSKHEFFCYYSLLVLFKFNGTRNCHGDCESRYMNHILHLIILYDHLPWAIFQTDTFQKSQFFLFEKSFSLWFWRNSCLFSFGQ